AVNTVGVGPFHDRLFSIEKHEFERALQFQIRRGPRHLQHPRGAGPSVIGADKTEIRNLSVVVADERDGSREGAGARGSNIDHLPNPTRSHGLKFVQLRLQARLLQFRHNVAARPGKGLAACRARAKPDDLCQIVKRTVGHEWRILGRAYAAAVKAVPDRDCERGRNHSQPPFRIGFLRSFSPFSWLGRHNATDFRTEPQPRSRTALTVTRIVFTSPVVTFPLELNLPCQNEAL